MAEEKQVNPRPVVSPSASDDAAAEPALLGVSELSSTEPVPAQVESSTEPVRSSSDTNETARDLLSEDGSARAAGKETAGGNEEKLRTQEWNEVVKEALDQMEKFSPLDQEGRLQQAQILEGVIAKIGAMKHSEIVPHALVEKKGERSWTDMGGKSWTVSGTFTRCVKDGRKNEGELVFTMEYDDKSRQIVNEQSYHFAFPIPLSDHYVSEEEAWGFYFAGLHGKRSTLDRPEFYYTLHTPAMRSEQRNKESHCRENSLIVYKQYILEFEVKRSTIDDESSVFVTVTSPYEETADFKLKAGHLVDIGIVTPNESEEIKSSIEWAMKFFVHEFRPSAYPSQTKEGKWFDVTKDDQTAQLREEAKRNALVHIKEIEEAEKATSSLCLLEDPCGNYHAYLGHHKKEQGDLVIQLGKATELRMERGRDTPTDALEKQTVANISNYSGEDIAAALTVVKNLFKLFKHDRDRQQRILVLALALLCRATILGDEEVEAQRFVKEIASSLNAETVPLSMELLKAIVAGWKTPTGDPENTDGVSTADLQELVDALEGEPLNKLAAVLVASVNNQADDESSSSSPNEEVEHQDE